MYLPWFFYYFNIIFGNDLLYPHDRNFWNHFKMISLKKWIAEKYNCFYAEGESAEKTYGLPNGVSSVIGIMKQMLNGKYLCLILYVYMCYSNLFEKMYT